MRVFMPLDIDCIVCNVGDLTSHKIGKYHIENNLNTRSVIDTSQQYTNCWLSVESENSRSKTLSFNVWKGRSPVTNCFIAFSRHRVYYYYLLLFDLMLNAFNSVRDTYAMACCMIHSHRWHIETEQREREGVTKSNCRQPSTTGAITMHLHCTQLNIVNNMNGCSNIKRNSKKGEIEKNIGDNEHDVLHAKKSIAGNWTKGAENIEMGERSRKPSEISERRGNRKK